MLLQPRQQLRNLVDAGNSAASKLDKLGIDLRCRCLGNLAGSLSESASTRKPRSLTMELNCQVACSVGDSGDSRP